MAATYAPPASLLPPTDNAALDKYGTIALYTPALFLITQGIFQHGIVFGILFLLRGFSSRRAIDLHYLTIILALSLVIGGLVFIIDQNLDATKLFFFLEHEAVEFLIAIRVMAPSRLVRERPGRIIFACWTGLSIVTIAVSLDQFYHVAAEVVAWGAFVSDFCVAIAGFVLIFRYFLVRRHYYEVSSFTKLKTAVEAMGGLGYIIHGFTTMSVPPIFSCVLHNDLDPSWFAWAWVVVFGSALFTVALSVPSAAMLFSTIQWCCWHRQKILPGEAMWEEDNNQVGDVEKGTAGDASNKDSSDSTVVPDTRNTARTPLEEDRFKLLSFPPVDSPMEMMRR